MRETKRINRELINCEIKESDYQDEKIISLIEAIKNDVVFNTITLKENNGRYDVLADENVLKAYLINGNEEIEANVLTNEDNAEINATLLQNMQRVKNSVIDEALAMEKIMVDEDITQVNLAKRLGLKQSTIANKLRLLKLPDYVKKAVDNGILTERHARALLKVESEKLEDVFNTIVNRKYNVKKTEEYIKGLNIHSNRGVSNNVRIGINTVEEAYKLCKKSGLDCDFSSRESEDEIKVIIRFKK